MNSEQAHELARSKLSRFARKLRELTKYGSFHLLVAGGNSGIVTAYIAKFVFEELKIDVPPMVLIPFYRFEPDHPHDESYRVKICAFSANVKKQLETVPQHEAITRVLFVDDEMGSGSTMAGVLTLVKEGLAENDHIKQCIAVVERHPNPASPPTQIGDTQICLNTYDDFSEINGAIMHLVKEPVGDIKVAFCHKLGAPIRYFNGGSPVLRETNEPDLEFIADLKDQIKVALKD